MKAKKLGKAFWAEKDGGNFGQRNSEKLCSAKLSRMEANLNGCASRAPLPPSTPRLLLFYLSHGKTFYGNDIYRHHYQQHLLHFPASFPCILLPVANQNRRKMNLLEGLPQQAEPIELRELTCSGNAARNRSPWTRRPVAILPLQPKAAE